jgi:hypothetical protein
MKHGLFATVLLVVCCSTNSSAALLGVDLYDKLDSWDALIAMKDNPISQEEMMEVMYLTGYVIAISEVLDEKSFQIPEGEEGGPICEAVVAYIRSHPDRLGIPACTLVAEALSEKWPMPVE